VRCTACPDGPPTRQIDPNALHSELMHTNPNGRIADARPPPVAVGMPRAFNSAGPAATLCGARHTDRAGDAGGFKLTLAYSHISYRQKSSNRSGLARCTGPRAECFYDRDTLAKDRCHGWNWRGRSRCAAQHVRMGLERETGRGAATLGRPSASPPVASMLHLLANNGHARIALLTDSF
jgi:hypothetical protein